MASPLIGVSNSSLQVRDVIGNNNEVYYAKYSVHFDGLNPEVKETLEKVVNQIMHERLIHQVPDNRPLLAVEGTSDALALYEPLKELANAMEEKEVKGMIEMFCMSCQMETRPASVQDLFSCMFRLGKLKLQDFTYLQCLLWKVGRKDLFKTVAEKARELQELHREDDKEFWISHLDAPNLEPIAGYRYVKFHLNVDLLDIGPERLRKLEVELAKILGVPWKYVAVVGVEPDQSAWVTVIMPFEACKALELNFNDGSIQNFLLSLNINKVGFFPDPPEVSESMPTTCALQTRGDWNSLAERSLIPTKEGRMVESEVAVTFRLEGSSPAELFSPKQQNVHAPVGLLKQEMEDLLDVEAADQVWIYNGQELEDTLALDHYVPDQVSHIDILVKVPSSGVSD